MSTENTILIHQYLIGPMENFIYIIADPKTQKAAIVDPGFEADYLLREVGSKGYTLDAILLTHGHWDHVQETDKILAQKKVPVYISAHELVPMKEKLSNLTEVSDGDTISIGDLTLEVLHTPGHSPGGQCFYHAPHLITGDTLFVDGCGRCDLPGSNPDDMWKSLQRIMALPDETLVYVGHNYGPKKVDTIGNQKKTNRFLVCSTWEHFLRKRMS